ncbi:MAG: hypothetical protein IPI72_10150 [Flavobacteriales bacterium]|nr:hypothetical protein [Flavobacteriales bacterium]
MVRVQDIHQSGGQFVAQRHVTKLQDRDVANGKEVPQGTAGQQRTCTLP